MSESLRQIRVRWDENHGVGFEYTQDGQSIQVSQTDTHLEHCQLVVNAFLLPFHPQSSYIEVNQDGSHTVWPRGQIRCGIWDQPGKCWMMIWNIPPYISEGPTHDAEDRCLWPKTGGPFGFEFTALDNPHSVEDVTQTMDDFGRSGIPVFVLKANGETENLLPYTKNADKIPTDEKMHHSETTSEYAGYSYEALVDKKMRLPILSHPTADEFAIQSESDDDLAETIS